MSAKRSTKFDDLPLPADRKLRGVIYARYSSHNQTEQSIEGQVQAARAYAAQHGIQIAYVYADRDMTATNDDRPDFQKMLSDSDKRLFDVVLVYTFDRFARNRYDSAINKKRLRVNGVRIISVSEPIPDSPEGILLESMLEGYAEYFSRELARKTTRGMRMSAEKGLSNGGSIPLGYKTIEKRYVIDEEKAPAIRRMFTMYADNVPVRSILYEMGRLGLRTQPTKKVPEGKPLTPTTLRSVIGNKKYIGVYHWHGVENDGIIPPITDPETFEKCQVRMREAKKIMKRSGTNIDYFLTAKLTCGKCGSYYVGDSGTGKCGEIYRYYTCNTRKRNKACDSRHFRKEDLESLVLEYTRNVVLTPSNIQLIASQAENAQATDTSVITALENRLQDVRFSLSNIARAIEQGIFTATTKDRLLALESEQEELSEKLASEKMRLELCTVPAAAIAYWLETFREGSLADTLFCRRLVDSLINNIFVFEDHIVIAYNYKNGSERISLEDLPPEAVTVDSDESDHGAPSGTRTRDTLIKSQVLYQLS